MNDAIHCNMYAEKVPAAALVRAIRNVLPRKKVVSAEPGKSIPPTLFQW